MYRALMLLGFFGFYRLSTLVPPSRATVSPSRFPTHGDVIWGAPGAHIVTKCTKIMQISGHVQVVQLPLLQDPDICPVAALKAIVSRDPKIADKQLFTVSRAGQTTVLSAPMVRTVLRELVKQLGLLSSEFGYHSFRRSGACWAFGNNIQPDQIKVHRGWKSDTIWRYLVKTPSAADTIVHAF